MRARPRYHDAEENATQLTRADGLPRKTQKHPLEQTRRVCYDYAMRSVGSKKFSDIFKQVYRKSGGHGLTSRLDALQDRRAERLQSIGVRPLSRNLGLKQQRGYGHEEHIYHAAFEALKKSNKSWASESEVRAILYGDKELSHERSAEVIEVLRRAGVPGFKETDESTSGDVYSERMLKVINAQQKEKLRNSRQKTMDKQKQKDTVATTADENKDDALTDEPSTSRISPLTEIASQTSGLENSPKERTRQGVLTDERAPFIGIPMATKHSKKITNTAKNQSPTRNDKDADEIEVPLAFDLNDE